MRILIVRFAAIGDCVMTAWPVTALRSTVPEAELVWAVQEKCAPVIDTDRLVNQLHVFPRERWKAHRWSPSTWREQIAHYTALRRTGIDVGFDFQGHSKTALCLRLAGCQERFASRATDALAARLNPPSQLKPEGPHEVQLAMALIQARFDVDLPEKPMMPQASEGNPVSKSDRPLVTIQTGAGESDKQYPSAFWDLVADQISSTGAKVVAIGGPADPRLSSPSVNDQVGRLTLRESLALVADSDLHLAGDTGTGHAAAAYGVPTVSVFGRTDPQRFRPWGRNAIVLREGARTSEVQPGQVAAAALTVLEAKPVASAH